jgi:hypothetical protein
MAVAFFSSSFFLMLMPDTGKIRLSAVADNHRHAILSISSDLLVDGGLYR